MAHLITLDQRRPIIDPEAFLASTAQIIGDVTIGSQTSIWYNVVLRGDVMPIKIGKQSNIQDGTIVHGTHHRCGVTVHDRVTVGHMAILHGCELHTESFVGMGAVVMDLCEVVPRSMVGAGALLTEKTVTKEGWLYLGRPAKAIRPLNDEELKFLTQSAQNYMNYSKWYSQENLSKGGKNDY